MSTKSLLKPVLFMVIVALCSVASLLVGMRSAMTQGSLFTAVKTLWSEHAPAATSAPILYNRFDQLAAYPGKAELPRPAVRERTLVAFVFGQSNAANAGGERFEADGDRILNYWDGRFYRAADPLLGATGRSGSPWVTTANRLVARGLWDQVVLLPAGVNGSSVQQWRQGGRLHGMYEDRLREAQRQGLQITHFLWHQGEEDNPSGRPSWDAEAYRTGLAEVIALSKRYFPKSAFFVAQASLCGLNADSAELRKVQASMAQLDGVFLGPNTDQISSMDRYDGCHLSGRGIEQHAEGWVQALARPRKSPAPAAPTAP